MLGRFLLLFGVAVLLGLASSRAHAGQTVLAVIGAGGEEEYHKQFLEWTAHWEKAAAEGEAEFLSIGQDPGQTNDLARLQERLSSLPRAGEPLWLVFIGHGTFDGKEAKFNLRGPDLSAGGLAKALDPMTRTVVIINTSSSSAPFMNVLSRSNRVIITATRSGHEQNFARLGEYLSESIRSPHADLDKDGQTSLLEAFVLAARQTADFYRNEGRLATEHALLDDNADGLGTQADWFRGVRAVKKPQKGAADGMRAHQLHLVRSERERSLSPETRARRDEVEAAIAKLREAKDKLKDEEYYQQLEPLLIEIARLYETADGPRPEALSK